jgi:hypothetical protein
MAQIALMKTVVPIPEGVERSEEEPEDEDFQGSTGSGGGQPVAVKMRIPVHLSDKEDGLKS